MRATTLRILVGFAMLSLGACASEWKIHGGPKDCVRMCANWNMELTAMVGVGSQESSGPGATACVCQPRGGETAASTEKRAGGASSAALAAPITAQAAAAAAAAQQQRQQSGK